MTIPIWLICIVLTIVVWVPAFRHESSGSYDFSGGILGLATLGVTAAIWLAYIAFVIGRATP